MNIGLRQNNAASPARFSLSRHSCALALGLAVAGSIGPSDTARAEPIQAGWRRWTAGGRGLERRFEPKTY